MRNERLREALDLAAQAISHDPGTPEIRHTYADICLRLNCPNAIAAVEDWIVHSRPENWDEHRHDVLATLRTLVQRNEGSHLLEVLKSQLPVSAWSSWIVALEVEMKLGITSSDRS
jgi:hypothetical protein